MRYYLARCVCVCVCAHESPSPLFIFSIFIRYSTLMGSDSLIIFHLATYADKLHGTELSMCICVCVCARLTNAHAYTRNSVIGQREPARLNWFVLVFITNFDSDKMEISIMNIRYFLQFSCSYRCSLEKKFHIKPVIKIIFHILRNIRSHRPLKIGISWFSIWFLEEEKNRNVNIARVVWSSNHFIYVSISICTSIYISFIIDAM